MRINDIDVAAAMNNVTTVGCVSEYDIKVTECVRECNIEGEIRKVNTVWLGGKVTLDVNGSNIKMSLKYLDTIRHLRNGNISKSFTSILTAIGYEAVYDEAAKKLVYKKLDRGLTPRVQGKITFVDANKNIVSEETINAGTPTRVRVTGRLGLEDGLNRDQTDLVFYNDLPISFISTTNVPEKDECSFTVEGVVKNVVDEIGTNGQATGRYLIDIVTPNFVGVDVFNFVMLPKWDAVINGEDCVVTKEEFYGSADSFCEIGDSVRISGDIEAHTFGAVEEKKTTGKSFGGGAKSTKNGFTRTEWTIKAGDIMETPYDNELIAMALEERDVYNEKNLQAKLEYAKNNATKKEATAAPKTNSPFANSAPKSSPFGGNTQKRNPFAV